MKNKRILFLKKISDINNVAKNDDEERKKLAKLVIDEIDREYIPPSDGKLNQNEVNKGIKASEELLSMNEGELEELKKSIQYIQEMDDIDPNQMTVKNSDDDFHNLIKLSYLNDLKKLNNEYIADHIYGMTFKKISLEEVRLSDNKIFKKISIDVNDIDHKEALMAMEAFELTKRSFLGNLWKSINNYGLKALPIVGIIFSLYSSIKHINISFNAWDKELSKFGDLGNIGELCSDEHMLNLYKSNKNDIYYVLNLVKAIKTSRSFILNFILSITYLLDLIEQVLTLPIAFTGLGAILEILLSLGILFGGEWYAEEKADEMLVVLSLIREDMLKIINN